jgi:hypothetical protein
VVVFPSLNNVAESQPITERIINLYKEQGVPTLDVATLIEGIPVDQLMASPVDTHPNEFVNQLVAEALYHMLQQGGW